MKTRSRLESIVFLRPPYKIAKNEFEHIVNLGIIRRSSSNWSFTLNMFPKKSGDWRPYCDYRALNSITFPDNYSIPYIQDFSSNLRNKKISKISLAIAYNQIPVTDADISKTAIATSFGLLELLRIPFGLRNASQIIRHFIDEALHDTDFFCLCR